MLQTSRPYQMGWFMESQSPFCRRKEQPGGKPAQKTNPTSTIVVKRGAMKKGKEKKSKGPFDASQHQQSM